MESGQVQEVSHWGQKAIKHNNVNSYKDQVKLCKIYKYEINSALKWKQNILCAILSPIWVKALQHFLFEVILHSKIIILETNGRCFGSLARRKVVYLIYLIAFSYYEIIMIRTNQYHWTYPSAIETYKVFIDAKRQRLI
jgi:hypothetical protein